MIQPNKVLLAGIRAKSIAPGAVWTPLNDEALGAIEGRAAREREMIAPHPLARGAEAWEIAAVASFRLSEDSSYVTGQTIAVDGGLSVRCVPNTLDPALQELLAARARR